MGSSKCLDRHTPIVFNGGGHRSDQGGGPHCLFRIQVPLISGVFASLYLLYYLVDSRFLKGFIPKGCINSFFDFFITFAGSGEPGDEIVGTAHVSCGEGCSGLWPGGRP